MCPGASTETIAALAAKIGAVPTELEAWFRWHDGATDADAPAPLKRRR
jgi:hypothetical protein